jgi:DNA-binding NarL/FixJ family response regulator
LYKKALLLFNDSLFAVSFIALLKDLNLFEEVAGYTQAEGALELMKANDADHLFIDLGRHSSDVLAYIKQIAAAGKTLYIIVVSSLVNANLISKINQAGGHAFISKNSGKLGVEECLPVIHAGNYFISQDVFNSVLKMNLHNKKEVFTEREQEILNHIVSGKTIREISIALHISYYTVANHRHNMMKKLEVHNMQGLIKKAIETGAL